MSRWLASCIGIRPDVAEGDFDLQRRWCRRANMPTRVGEEDTETALDTAVANMHQEEKEALLRRILQQQRQLLASSAPQHG
jgi:hypothetical protein